MKAYKSELAERCTQEQLHEAVHGKKLQTKPQTKPLSDEEIMDIYKTVPTNFINFPKETIDFARAILKKASE